MIRPTFLDNPHGQTVRSTPADRVRASIAIERPAALPWRLNELVFIVVVAALGLIGWIVSAGGI